MSREVGKEAEDLAVATLETAGYKVVTRNYNCRVGEIDIVAEKDGILSFVEVKYRSHRGFGTAIDAITNSKMRKILLAAKNYLYEAGKPDADYRIDAVVIDGKEIEVIPNIYTQGM